LDTTVLDGVPNGSGIPTDLKVEHLGKALQRPLDVVPP